MDSPVIVVIVPVFNEASILEQTLSALMAYDHHIILVDDGSTDDTDVIARKFPLILIRHSMNLGQGAALRTGMEAAKNMNADFAIHFDADGQHDAGEIQNLLTPLFENQCDIVFGSRFSENNKGQSIPRIRKLILHMARYVNWVFYGIFLSDAHNGFRAMNRMALEKIVFTQKRMGHASEVLYLVKKNKLRFKEIPITIHYTGYSRKKGQNIFNSINILFDLIFK